MTMEELTNISILNKCTLLCTKQSRWKETTQRYIANMTVNNMELRHELLTNSYNIRKTINFIINERGKTRFIEVPSIRDRVIQKAVTQYILIPSLKPYVIYDNYASIKGRGTSFARKRFEILLRKYISKHGKDGYIMLIDIKKYFDNIDHSILKDIVGERIKNEPDNIKELVNKIIDFGSSTNKGLNIGSEAPQILAVYYLNIVDTFVKIVKHVKYYGRYMDDMFVISDNKNELKSLLDGIRSQLSKLKLEINEKKTHIIKLKHGFTFLQIKYNITDTGKIIKRMSHKKVIRERRRLNAFKKRNNIGQMKRYDINNCYKSWRGCVIKDHNKCYNTLRSIDNLYRKLFGQIEVNTVKRSRKDIVNKAFKEIDFTSVSYNSHLKSRYSLHSSPAID